MNYDWSMTVWLILRTMDTLATAIDTCCAGHPFIAMHHKQPGERLRDKDLAAQGIGRMKEYFADNWDYDGPSLWVYQT